MTLHLPGVERHPETGRHHPPPATPEAPRSLTDAELAVLAAVEDLHYENGYAPTLLEIAERIGWRSTGSVSRYLDRLRGYGLIEGRGRTLRVNP
jgi:DNA-binding MarR family transcriptional regulator